MVHEAFVQAQKVAPVVDKWSSGNYIISAYLKWKDKEQLTLFLDRI